MIEFLIPKTLASKPHNGARFRRLNTKPSIGDVELLILEGVMGDLRPGAVLLQWSFVNIDVLDLQLTPLLSEPKIDVVTFPIATLFPKIRADNILVVAL